MLGYKSGINLRELIFISYAGMIRGAVAFGLVLRINEDIESRSVIVTTSLVLVAFTTVVNGSTVAVILRILFGKVTEEEHHGDKGVDESHHEFITHPNMEEEQQKDGTVFTTKPGESRFNAFFRRLDQMKLKPWLLYKYEKERYKKQKEYKKLLQEKGEEENNVAFD